MSFLFAISMIMKKPLSYTGEKTLFIGSDGLVSVTNPYIEKTSNAIVQVFEEGKDASAHPENNNLLPEWISEVEYIDAMNKEEESALYEQGKKFAVDASTGLVTDPSWMINENA